MQRQFNWEKAKARAVTHLVQRNITLANPDKVYGNNTDFISEHNDWVTDAKSLNYVKIKADTKAQILKAQKAEADRRLKIVS